MFSWLTKWWKRRGRRADLRVVMFTRQGCHLCEAAWELLQDRRKTYGFSLEMIDIDTSAELVSQFGECVPVVEINGQVRFRGQVNDVLLRRLLDHG